jgi:hypothetical protein
MVWGFIGIIVFALVAYNISWLLNGYDHEVIIANKNSSITMQPSLKADKPAQIVKISVPYLIEDTTSIYSDEEAENESVEKEIQSSEYLDILSRGLKLEQIKSFMVDTRKTNVEQNEVYLRTAAAVIATSSLLVFGAWGIIANNKHKQKLTNYINSK